MISERFRDTAHQYRDSLAIIDEGQEITYGQLLERSGAMRRWLQDNLSPKPGEVIAASLSNTWQFVAAFFAVSELGGVFMPCNPHWRAEELRWCAGRLGFRGVITEPQFRAEWDRLDDVMRPESVLTVDLAACRSEPDAALNPLPFVRRSEDDPAVYLPTSGSTGVPRVVPRTQRNLEAVARNVARALGIGPGRRFLSVIPFFHANGFHNCMLMPLINGATLVLMKQFSPAACAELVHRERVDVLIGSPVLFTHLADSGVDPRVFCPRSGSVFPPLRECLPGSMSVGATGLAFGFDSGTGCRKPASSRSISPRKNRRMDPACSSAHPFPASKSDPWLRTAGISAPAPSANWPSGRKL